MVIETCSSSGSWLGDVGRELCAKRKPRFGRWKKGVYYVTPAAVRFLSGKASGKSVGGGSR